MWALSLIGVVREANTFPPPEELPPRWLFIAFPLWLGLTATFQLFVKAHLGSWTSLTQRYAAAAPPAGGYSYRKRSAWVNCFARYQRCLNITLLGTGIHVRPVWYARWFHPPLLLPWEGVKQVYERRVAFFFRQTVIRFADTAGRAILLYLPAEARREVREVSRRPDLL